MNFFSIQYSDYVLIGGLIVVGVSFFLPKKYVEAKDGNPDLLDD
jgi:hypothetical protein